MPIVAIAVFLVLLPACAISETLNTPQCRAAIDEANRLMRAVAARQMQFNRFDPVENCRLLRDNLDDLAAARGPLEHCLTGDEHTRSLSQVDAAIAQIRAQLIGNCRR